jgi:tetratricopeptide (TPR) repeat protein
MANHPPEEQARRPKISRMRSIGAIFSVCVLIIFVFVWVANSGMLELWGNAAKDTYYNLLAQGFGSGQLSPNCEAPRELMQLNDPYDPYFNSGYRFRNHAPIADMSFYKGKLYLYFGATPALLLFLPYATITGHWLLHRYAVAIFCSIGFLASACLLHAIWRRYFANVKFAVLLAGTLATGFGSGAMLLLPRCDVHEVAISCGYAFVMLSVGALWRAIHDQHRNLRWLAVASLLYGLAIGARPSLLPGAIVLLMPIIFLSRTNANFSSSRRRCALLFSVVSPITLVGVGLMLYNARRFDNPFEFGWHYQLTTPRQDIGKGFSLSNLWFNFRLYFLQSAHWTFHFPFVNDVTVPNLPEGYGGTEHPFGVLMNVPFVLLALAAPLGLRKRFSEERSRLRCFLIVVTLIFAVSASVLCLFFSACARYELEFLPALMFLAVVGVFSLERELENRSWLRRLARVGYGALLIFSIAFNLLASAFLAADNHAKTGYAFLQVGRVEEATTQFQKALKIKPSIAEAHNYLGWIYFQKNKFDDAIREYEDALRLKPDYADARNNLSIALAMKSISLSSPAKH